MQTVKRKKVIILTGPTATGKSSLSLELADKFNFEIVNIDSMQVYKYFNIGTDKPEKSILANYPHHLIDYVEPNSEYNANIYTKDADRVVDEVVKNGKLPLFVGGTGLYIKCFLFGMIDEDSDSQDYRNILEDKNLDYLYTKLKIIDHDSYLTINKNDKYRIVRALSYYYTTGKSISYSRNIHKFREPKYDYIKIALNFDRQSLYQKINIRVDKMVELGLFEECEELIKLGYKDSKPMNGIGYKEVKDFFCNKVRKNETIELIKQHSRRYAKRQITWFKRESDILWFYRNQKCEIYDAISKFINQ